VQLLFPLQDVGLMTPMMIFVHWLGHHYFIYCKRPSHLNFLNAQLVLKKLEKLNFITRSGDETRIVLLQNTADWNLTLCNSTS